MFLYLIETPSKSLPWCIRHSSDKILEHLFPVLTTLERHSKGESWDFPVLNTSNSSVDIAEGECRIWREGTKRTREFEGLYISTGLIWLSTLGGYTQGNYYLHGTNLITNLLLHITRTQYYIRYRFYQFQHIKLDLLIKLIITHILERKDVNSMVTSEFSCKKALAGTVWAISLLLYMHDWDLTGKYPWESYSFVFCHQWQCQPFSCRRQNFLWYATKDIAFLLLATAFFGCTAPLHWNVQWGCIV